MNAVIDKARRIASSAHLGQVDRQGMPYINHPLRVSRIVSSFFSADDPSMEHAEAVALLHDVIENSSITASDLLFAGIKQDIVGDIIRLTKLHSQSRDTYLDGIKQSRIAWAVKLADIADNTDPARLAVLQAQDKERLLDKYHHYYSYLMNGVDFYYCDTKFDDNPTVRMLGERFV